jgi:hypothetical protein
MDTVILLPKSEYPKDKPLMKMISVQPSAKKIADTNLTHDKKANGKKHLTQFNTEDIFKAKKHELF